MPDIIEGEFVVISERTIPEEERLEAIRLAQRIAASNKAGRSWRPVAHTDPETGTYSPVAPERKRD